MQATNMDTAAQTRKSDGMTCMQRAVKVGKPIVENLVRARLNVSVIVPARCVQSPKEQCDGQGGLAGAVEEGEE